MRATQIVDNEPRSTGDARPGRWRRRLGLCSLVGGVLVLLAAFVPTTASAQTTGSSLPPGSVDLTYTCAGADAATQALLANPIVNLPTFPITATIVSDPLNSPDTGGTFDMAFTWTFTQSAALVATSVGLGVTDLGLSNAADSMHVVSGATGPDVVGNPPAQTVGLGDGTQPISYNQGPFSGTFTRTNAIGEPLVFAPGPITVTVAPNPLTVSLNLVCTPDPAAQISIVDQAGPPPPPISTTTTAPLPPAPPRPAGTSGGTGGSGTGGSGVSATSSTPLARTGFHPELLYVGIALLGAGYALSLAGRRVARAGARSR